MAMVDSGRPYGNRRQESDVSDKYIRITGCDIGVDSKSGKAFSCEIDGEQHWIPYSQCRRRAIYPNVHGSDMIEVTRWFAEQKELEGEEVE